MRNSIYFYWNVLLPIISNVFTIEVASEVFQCLCCLIRRVHGYIVMFRGSQIVGPFVVMIYKMIHTDLLRFFAIYLVFLVGFSQGNSIACLARLLHWLLMLFYIDSEWCKQLIRLFTKYYRAVCRWVCSVIRVVICCSNWVCSLSVCTRVAMFVLFRGYNNETFSNPVESMLGMFRMSLGAFGEIYETFDDSIQDPAYIWAPRVGICFRL